MADYHKERTQKVAQKASEKAKTKRRTTTTRHERLLRRDKCWKETVERGEATVPWIETENKFVDINDILFPLNVCVFICIKPGVAAFNLFTSCLIPE